MIAFAVCIGSRENYERYCRPGLAAHGGPDSPVAEIETDSIFSGYNEALDAFAPCADLLVHNHTRGGVGDSGNFWQADQTLRRKWTALGREMARDDEMRPDMRTCPVMERE